MNRKGNSQVRTGEIFFGPSGRRGRREAAPTPPEWLSGSVPETPLGYAALVALLVAAFLAAPWGLWALDALMRGAA